MKKLKVLTVVGTRPEIIRLSRVLAQLDEHCEHLLVHTGQNYDYELNQVFFDDLRCVILFCCTGIIMFIIIIVIIISRTTRSLRSPVRGRPCIYHYVYTTHI